MSPTRVLAAAAALGALGLGAWWLTRGASAPDAPAAPPIASDRRLAVGVRTDAAGLLTLLRPAAAALSWDAVARIEGPGCDAAELVIEDLAGLPGVEGAARAALLRRFPPPERLPGASFPTWTSERVLPEATERLRLVGRGRVLYVLTSRSCAAEDARSARLEALADAVLFDHEREPDPGTVLPSGSYMAPGQVANPLLAMDAPLGLAAIGEDGWTAHAGPAAEALTPGARMGLTRADGVTLVVLPLGRSRSRSEGAADEVTWWDEPVRLQRVPAPSGWRVAGRLADAVPWAWLEAQGPGDTPDLEAISAGLARLRPLDDETRRRMSDAASPPVAARYAAGVTVANGRLLDVVRGLTWQFDPLLWDVRPEPSEDGVGSWTATHLRLPLSMTAPADPEGLPDLHTTDPAAAHEGLAAIRALDRPPEGFVLLHQDDDALTLAVPGLRLARPPGSAPAEPGEDRAGWAGWADGDDEVLATWVAAPEGGAGPEASAERLLQRALAGLPIDRWHPTEDTPDADLVGSARRRTWSGPEGAVHAWSLLRAGAGVLVVVRDAPPVRPAAEWRALLSFVSDPPVVLAPSGG